VERWAKHDWGAWDAKESRFLEVWQERWPKPGDWTRARWRDGTSSLIGWCRWLRGPWVYLPWLVEVLDEIRESRRGRGPRLWDVRGAYERHRHRIMDREAAREAEPAEEGPAATPEEVTAMVEALRRELQGFDEGCTGFGEAGGCAGPGGGADP